MNLLEQAAEVRQSHKELKDLYEEIQKLQGNWTAYSLAGATAMNTALNGMSDSYAMLDRLKTLAKDEIKRIKAEKPKDPCYPVAKDPVLS